MPSKFNKAILKTLLYADVFDYPLTLEEFQKKLIGEKIEVSKLKKILLRHSDVGQKNGYFFLKGREKIVALRKKRKLWSEEKMRLAKRIIKYIKIIPTIKLIGISGSLAIGNSDQSDDVDIFIITSRNSLWTTRFFLNFFLDIFSLRRKPDDSDVKDKLCLNMFIDEENLSIRKEDRDLFTAHEIIQMKPIFYKDNTYKKFLRENIWVLSFLPNSNITESDSSTTTDKKGVWEAGLLFVENILRHIQMKFMRKLQMGEVVKRGIVKFHSQKRREKILASFRKRVEKSIGKDSLAFTLSKPNENVTLSAK